MQTEVFTPINYISIDTFQKSQKKRNNVYGKDSEHDFQTQVAKYLDSVNALFTISLSGLPIGPRLGSIAKTRGYKRGTPDIFVFSPPGKILLKEKRDRFKVLVIEMKSNFGSQSIEQNEWQKRLTELGVPWISVPTKKYRKGMNPAEYVISELKKLGY